MKHTPTASVFLLLTLTAVAPPATAQDAAPAAAPKPDQKLTEWPPLKDTDKDRVMAMVGQFRKADPALHEAAKKQLVAIGDSAMPLLFQQVSDRTENINTPLFAVFDTVLQPKHAGLMARESKKPRIESRRYLLRRLCCFTDAEMLPVLQAAMQDKDEGIAFYGALGALALKDRQALPAVLSYSKTHWSEVGPLVAEVLPKARCTETGAWVFEAIAKASTPDQMAGLRLVRYLAVKDQTVILRTYLQAPDHTVKKEAVNAMRVLHGEAPMENLSVFQVIEMSKQWLQKA